METDYPEKVIFSNIRKGNEGAMVCCCSLAEALIVY